MRAEANRWIEGGGLRISCSGDGASSEYTFIRDGQPLGIDVSVVRSLNQITSPNEQFLIIDELTVFDSGDYQCTSGPISSNTIPVNVTRIPNPGIQYTINRVNYSITRMQLSIIV